MLVLDTHAWLYWVHQDKKLPARARNAIEEADVVLLNVFSIMEVAYLDLRGRLSLGLPFDKWLKAAIDESDITVVEIDAAFSRAAGRLDYAHGDPVDRCVIQTAIAHKVPLVTKDQHMTDSGLVDVIWK